MNATKNKTQAGEAKVADSVLQLECDLVEIAREELGINEVEALKVAQVFVQGLRKRYGGMRIGGRGAAIYIPSPSKAERNKAICNEFDGTNHKAVMERHGIRRAQLYRIVSGKGASARIGLSSPKAP
ncbi:MAG: Mor transcription activator family protein [Comamonas sp.]